MTRTRAPDAQTPVPLSWGPLLEAHPLAHFVYDPVSLRLLAANQAALQRYGYSREAFLRLTRLDLLLPSEAGMLQQFLGRLPGSQTQEPQHVWLERTQDGRVLHADVRGMPVLFEGQLARLAAVVDAGVRQRLAADAAGARDLLEVAGRMAQLGAWRLDLLHKTVHWSDEVCAIHEVPPGSVYGLDAAIAFYPGGTATTVRALAEHCAEDGTPFDVELPFVGARGTQRWVRAAGAAVRDGSGAIVAIEGALQDITARKQDALALAESRTRMAALLGAIPDLWFVMDADGRYLEVSDPQHPSLSAPWPQKQGRRIEDTIPPDMASRARAHIALAHASGQPQAYHYEMDVLGGRRRTFEGRFVPLSGGRTMTLIRDVTESVQLEQRFRLMADTAPLGIFMTDPQGLCTYTNPAWQKLYGIGYEASLGKGWSATLHPDDRGRVFAHWRGQAASAAGCEVEFRVCAADGSVRTVAARSSPIRGADGAVTGHVGTVVDMTQARELEAARRAQAVAEEAGRRQAAFMSRMSHELRTPLNAILGFGQLLQQLPGAEARTALYAGHVVTAGKHMLALVDDLLALQRLEQGRVQLEIAVVDLPGLLASCAELLRPLADAAGVQVQVQAPPGLVIHSDARCLRQMLLNLATNALKHGRAAQGPSQVVLAAQAAADGVHLSVADNGLGMTPLQLQRLFKPFERLGQDAGAQAGSGLGLVITQHLAQLLGGQVHIESAVGSGTRALLYLPG